MTLISQILDILQTCLHAHTDTHTLRSTSGCGEMMNTPTLNSTLSLPEKV